MTRPNHNISPASRQALAVSIRLLLLFAVPLLGGALPGKWCCSNSQCQDEESWLTYVCQNNACVLSAIQPDGACTTAQDCSDANPCTEDECDSSNHCINTLMPGCCLGYSDEECSDNERCTFDFCDVQKPFFADSPDTGSCTHLHVPNCCHVAQDCQNCSSDKRTCIEGWCQRSLVANAVCTADSDCAATYLGNADSKFYNRCVTAAYCQNGKCHLDQKPNCCYENIDCAPTCKDAACTEYSDAAYRGCVRELCDADGIFLPVPVMVCDTLPEPIWCLDGESCDDGLPSTSDTCTAVSPCWGPLCQHTLGFSTEVTPCNFEQPETAAVWCDDGSACTVDTCLSVADFRDAKYGDTSTDTLKLDWSTVPPELGLKAGICVNTHLPGCCEAPEDCLCGEHSVASCLDYRCSCTSTGFCATSKDCYDGDACTIDTCEAGQCALLEIPGCCTEHEQCADTNVATKDLCDAATMTCKHSIQDTNCVDSGDCSEGSKCVNFTCVADGPQPKQCNTPLDCVLAYGPCGDRDFGANCVENKCVLSASSGCCDKGLRIVLAEASLKPKLDWNLQRLADDWRAEGACAAVFYLKEDTLPESIQNRLLAYIQYSRSKPGLLGVAGLFLVGRISPFAVPVYLPKNSNEGSVADVSALTDAGAEDLVEVWAMTDQVYMAPEGPWEKTSAFARKWRHSLLTSDLAEKYPLSVGRIMVPSKIGGELNLLNRYLNKLHAFRYGGKAEWASGNGRAVLFSPYAVDYWGDQLAGMKALFGVASTTGAEVCHGTGSIGQVDIVQAPASTKAKLFEVLAQSYYWMTVESHLNVKEWDLAVGTLKADEIKSSAQVGPNFFWHQTCHSGEIATLDQSDGTWTWEDDSYALRLLEVGFSRGLEVVARGSTGRDSCHHEIFYKALANGKSIGDALRERLYVTVRKLRLNEFDKCDTFEKVGFTTILFGDPFLVPRTVED